MMSFALLTVIMCFLAMLCSFAVHTLMVFTDLLPLLFDERLAVKLCTYAANQAWFAGCRWLVWAVVPGCVDVWSACAADAVHALLIAATIPMALSGLQQLQDIAGGGVSVAWIFDTS
jgi:hypothetical protein